MPVVLVRLAWAAAFVLTWLLLLRFGSPPAGSELDLSWGAVLGWAFSNDARFGTEIAFTFGPLGFLYPTASYYPGSWPAFWLGQIMLTAITAGVFTAMATSLSPWIRAGWFALLWSGFIWLAGDAAWHLSAAALIAASPTLLADHRSATIREVAFVLFSASYLSVLALLKFSLFPALVIFVGTTCLLVALRKGLAWSFLTLTSAVAILVGTWWLSGQAMAGLPNHLIWSLRISAGYAEAMAMAPALRYDILLSTFAAAIVAFAAMVGLRKPFSLARMLAAMAVVAVFAIAWRSGMTRVSPEKIVFIVPLLGGFLATLAVLAQGWRLASGLAATGLFLAAIATAALAPMGPRAVAFEVAPQLMVRNVRTIMDPSFTEDAFKSVWTQKLAENRLDAIAAMVEGDSVDLVSHSQGLVFLNGFNYSPRPVFQGYAAYGQALARLNETHFLGDRAPNHVIFSVQPIDGRLPGSEDSLTLTSLLRGYDPVLLDGGQLLLSRTAEAFSLTPVRPPPESEWLKVPVGEFVDIPATSGIQAVVLFARLQRPAWSRASSALLRPDPLHIEVQTGDDRLLTFRVVPGVLPGGVVVEPLMETTVDAAKWMAGFGDLDPASKARRLRFLSGESWPQQDQLVELAFSVLDRSAPKASLFDDSLIAALIPGFSHLPDRRSGVIRGSQEAGAPTLLVHPPAWIEFAVTPGAWTLEGIAGIHAVTATLPECASADGAQLRVSVADVGSIDFLDLGLIDLPAPRFDPGGSSVEELAYGFSSQSSVRIRLSVNGGAAEDLTCDWAYLRDLQFVPVTAN